MEVSITKSTKENTTAIKNLCLRDPARDSQYWPTFSALELYFAKRPLNVQIADILEVISIGLQDLRIVRKFQSNNHDHEL